MSQPSENILLQPFRNPAIEAGIVLTVAAVCFLSATQPLFPIYLLPASLLVVAVVSFDSFIYAMVLLMPWYPLPTIDLPVRDAFLALRFVMLIGVVIVRYRSREKGFGWLTRGIINKSILAFAVAATVSLFLSPFVLKLDAFRSLVRWCSYLAMFFALTGWIQNRRQIVQLIKLLLISSICVCLFGFYQELTGGYSDLYLYLFEAEIPDWNGRIPSFLFHFNALAAYLNLLVPFALGYFLLQKDRGLERLGWISFCTATAALYLTGSRGGLLAYGGILLVAVVYVMLRFRPRSPKLTSVLLAIVTAAIIVSVVVPRASDQEQSTRLQEVDDFTELSRLAIWASAATMFIEHPVLGVGYGNYRSLYSDYLTGVEADQLDAHDLYLQILAETGSIGFVLFMIPIVAMVWRGYKLLMHADPFYSMIGLGVVGALLSTLIHGAVDYFFHVQPQVGGLFWTVMAIGFVVSEDAIAKNTLRFQSRPVGA